MKTHGGINNKVEATETGGAKKKVKATGKVAKFPKMVNTKVELPKKELHANLPK